MIEQRTERVDVGSRRHLAPPDAAGGPDLTTSRQTVGTPASMVAPFGAMQVGRHVAKGEQTDALRLLEALHAAGLNAGALVAALRLAEAARSAGDLKPQPSLVWSDLDITGSRDTAVVCRVEVAMLRADHVLPPVAEHVLELLGCRHGHESNPRHPCSRVTFELKRRYLVFADATSPHKASAPLAVGPCSNTTSAQGAAREMARLDELRRRTTRRRR